MWKILTEDLNIIQNDTSEPSKWEQQEHEPCVMSSEKYMWPAGQRFEERERELKFKVTAV